MEYSKITSSENIYAAVDPADVHDNFDDESVSTVLFFYDGIPEEGGIIQHEAHVKLSQAYIDDTFGLTDSTTEKDRKVASLKALISIGQKSYLDKSGIPKPYNMIIGTRANTPLHYSVLHTHQDR